MLTGAAFSLAFLIALLAIPVDVNFSVQSHEVFRGRVMIAWMFGLVRLPTPPKTGKPSRPAPSPKTPKGKSMYKGSRSLVIMLRSEGFGLRLVRFAVDALSVMQVKILRLRVRLGLEDPADTGQIWGVVGPLTLILAGARGTDIEIEPDFERASLSVEGNAELRVIPIRVLVVVILFLGSPATLRAAWAVIASRRK
ncbi:MAG: DUF2953 domain-containing protein [Desulfomonilaceae bacterium]